MGMKTIAEGINRGLIACHDTSLLCRPSSSPGSLPSLVLGIKCQPFYTAVVVDSDVGNASVKCEAVRSILQSSSWCISVCRTLTQMLRHSMRRSEVSIAWSAVEHGGWLTLMRIICRRS